MKQLLRFAFLLVLGSPTALLAQSAPTVDTAYFPPAPDTLLYRVLDTTGQQGPGPAGPSVVWDFSSAAAFDSTDFIILDGGAQDTSGLFANTTHNWDISLTVADLVFPQSRFYTLTSSALVETGYRQDSVDLSALAGFTAYSLRQEYLTDSTEGDTLYTLPLNFGDSTTYGLVNRRLAGQVNFGAPLDIEIRQESNRTVVADGWGQLQLPDTTYDTLCVCAPP